ncbi:MAG: hypothetical protein K0U72_04600 [Gammaproteobacteria bacterium]|nr:hypothetical protein [Gammaproteobacteria bacterium]
MINLKKPAEIVGLAAVVLSLVFLGYELKRGNDIAEAEAIANMMAEFNGFTALVSSDEMLWTIWSRGSTDYESLNGEERSRFSYLANYVFNVYEMSFTYIENGLVDSQYIETFTRDFCGLIERNDGFGEFWKRTSRDQAMRLAGFAKSRCEISFN